jgi:hypothetical protein
MSRCLTFFPLGSTPNIHFLPTPTPSPFPSKLRYWISVAVLSVVQPCGHRLVFIASLGVHYYDETRDILSSCMCVCVCVYNCVYM